MDKTEQRRLEAVRALRRMDAAGGEAFDRLVMLAADLINARIALVSLVDEDHQWFKAGVGLDVCSTPRADSFCAHALELPAHSVMVVEDAQADDRFRDNALVVGAPHIRFYMGALLSDRCGNNLGTLCVIDENPRPTPSDRDQARLQSLAAMVVAELERLDTDRLFFEQRRLLAMAESMSGVGHWRFDVLSHEVTWSDEVYRIHGVDRDSFDPRLDDVISFYHEDDRPKLVTLIQNAIEKGEGYEFQLRLRRADGALREVIARATVETDRNGKSVDMFGVFQDVTDQVQALRDVEKSKVRYQMLTETMADVVVRVRLDGTSPYISPAVKGLLGYEPAEMAGQASHAFVAEADRPMVIATYAAMAAGQQDATLRHRVTHKDGHEIWVETRFQLVRDPQGQPREMVAVIRDISVRKALEDDLNLARDAAEAAAAVKADFLANMSHELRTPLTSIIGFTGLAAAQPDLPPLALDYIGRVENAGRALLCTVNDILDFSKLEAGQVAIRPEPTDMAALCRAALDMFTPQAGSKDLDLRLDLMAGAEGTFLVDPDRVRQILLNLVGNAVKFTDAGEVVLTVHHRDQRIHVTVQDTGAGVPADRLDRLFQRFSQIDGSMTRNHGGTGLGLAICKGLVEAMDGDIGADSVPGHGSRFWFTLPAPRLDDTRAVAAAATLDQITFGGIRVLVADDHPANRELARLFLAGVGAEVTEAHDGEAACEAAADWPFDVILMDVRMPVMDGPDALAQIRSRPGPNDITPILAFTADATVEDRARLMALGFDDVVAKPVEAEALIGAVARATAFALDGPTEIAGVG